MTRRLRASIVLALLLAFTCSLLLAGTARAEQCQDCDPGPDPDPPSVAVTLSLGATPTYGANLHATMATDKPEMDGGVSIAWERTGYADVTLVSGSEGSFDIPTAPRFKPGQTYYLRAHASKEDGSEGASARIGFTVDPITSALQFVNTTTTTPGAIKVKVNAVSPTGVAPTGAVRLDAGGTNLGQVEVDGQGVASFAGLQPGSYDVVASYAGNGIYTEGHAAATLRVLPVASNFQIEISDATPTQGDPVTLRVTPTSPEEHPVTGDWALSAVPAGGGVASPIAEVSMSGDPWDMDITDWVRDHVGSWTLTWTCSGNAWVAPSSSTSAGLLTIAAKVVTPPPGPGTPGTPGAPGTPGTPGGTTTQQKTAASVTGTVKRTQRVVTVTVVVTGASTPTGTVEIRDGKRLVRSVTLTGGRAVVRLKGLTKGRHALTATYLGSTTLLGARHRWNVRVR